MPSCPSCNKFCGLEMQEPEIQSMEISANEDSAPVRVLTISGEVRIVRNSECCGDEIKEASFCFDEEFEIEGHTGEGHEFEIDDGDIEPIEEGFGVDWSPEITCSCGKEVKRPNEETINFSDKVAASAMDDLV